MDFKQLQSFAVVVRCGSFTRAAHQLFVSQPTISAHIRSLEEELGRKLIVRTTKAIEVTPKGQEIYEYAVGILDLKERMQHACDDLQQRIIHLGASTIPSAYILPQMLSAFGRQYPNIYFSLHQSDSAGVAEGVLSGVFELGFLGSYDDTLNCIPVCRDRMVLISPVSKRYLEMKQAGNTPMDTLLDEPVILREKDIQNKRANRFLSEEEIDSTRLNIVARVNDQETVKNLVAGGLGISFISEIAGRNLIEEKRVLSFGLRNNDSRMLYLAHKKNIDPPAHIRFFIDFVKNSLQT